mmetsp:Transcript_22465/g.29385  ORF Transcript_22465/g.29385 Transcript_22465/m.29385 type:complete len:102 (+) Transcript_22465:70-375(+)
MLNAQEHESKFIEAGFDFDFIAQNGIKEEDLDCVGIPKEKMGIRKKLISLYRIQEVSKQNEDQSPSEQASGSDQSDDESSSSGESGSEESSDEASTSSYNS